MQNHAQTDVKKANPLQMYPNPAPISARRYGVTKTTMNPTTTFSAV